MRIALMRSEGLAEVLNVKPTEGWTEPIEVSPTVQITYSDIRETKHGESLLYLDLNGNWRVGAYPGNPFAKYGNQSFSDVLIEESE